MRLAYSSVTSNKNWKDELQHGAEIPSADSGWHIAVLGMLALYMVGKWNGMELTR